MRTLVLGTVAALLLTAGCVHHGKLRPPSGTTQVAGDGTHAIAEAHGVRLVAHGSSWEGHPQDVDRHLTPIQVRLENHSGRPLSVRFEQFELVGQQLHYALEPSDLRRAVSARTVGRGNVPESYGHHLSPRRDLAPSKPQHPPATAFNPYSGDSQFRAAPCHNCASGDYAKRIPSEDMLRLAFREGTLESSRTREGFLYFERAMPADRQVTLQARLLDAHTGEEFGTLSIPFEVY